MKNANLPGGAVAFTMFYAIVLLAAVVVPRLLAMHVDVMLPGVVRDATAATGRERAMPAPVEEAAAEPEVWDRLADRLVGRPAEGPRDSRMPGLDALVPRPGADGARLRRAGPDSGMIREGRVRVRSLKV